MVNKVVQGPFGIYGGSPVWLWLGLSCGFGRDRANCSLNPTFGGLRDVSGSSRAVLLKTPIHGLPTRHPTKDCLMLPALSSACQDSSDLTARMGVERAPWLWGLVMPYFLSILSPISVCCVLRAHATTEARVVLSCPILSLPPPSKGNSGPDPAL